MGSDKYIEIYIHNINFDGMLLINYLTKENIKFNIISNKANIYSLIVYYSNKEIQFKCSYKIINMPLRTLGEIENFPKSYFPYKFVNKKTINYIGEIPDSKYWEPGEYEKYVPTNSGIYDLKKETISYCENDVKLTSKVLKNLFDVIDTESVSIRKKSLTSASISHKIFYTKYNNFSIKESLKIEYETYIRKSYFGGRCEVYGNIRENEHIKYYDFSGMYGQCMTEKFHNGNCYYDKPTDFSKPGFYCIKYYSNINFLPVLPIHHNNKLLFVNGYGENVYWYEEIILFIEMGGVVLEIKNALIYDDYQHVFKEFVEKFSSIRSKGGYYKIFGKSVINSLYGSMAMTDRDIIHYITTSDNEFNNIMLNNDIESFKNVNGVYIIFVKLNYKSKHFFNKSNENNFTKRNIGYASAISSKARIKLYRALIQVIKHGGRLLYTDTDSIFAAYSKSDKKTKTGDIDWIKFYDDGVFISPKTYGLLSENNEYIKIKGVIKPDISFYDLKKKFYINSDITFNDQLTFYKSDFFLKQSYIKKNISLSNYDKREFILDKTDTKPLVINTT